ncbi:hypothetical protein, partial [Thiohalocapsa marina]|uniref:hypothetical protein n=1 Tax=Thiohalocapsa marina TaxID=424902 RepID=UPI001B886718
RHRPQRRMRFAYPPYSVHLVLGAFLSIQMPPALSVQMITHAHREPGEFIGRSRTGGDETDR